MIGTTISISKQYLLAGRARSKLLQCASTEKNKDYDLRILVGHANLLDRLMDNIDSFTYNQRQQENGSLQYMSSDDDFDEEEYELHRQDSFSDSEGSISSDSEEEDDDEDEVGIPLECPVGYYGSTPSFSKSDHFVDSAWEEESSERGYVPLKLGSPTRYNNMGEEEEESDGGSEEEEDEEGLSTDENDTEQDLSMMPIILRKDMPISV